MFDVKRLELLLRVIETGSVTAAAEQLRYSASAVSQQLKRLEQEVGQPLLQRRSRGMQPTEAGEVLAGHARKVLRQLSAAEADLAEIAGLSRGTLEFGTFPTMGASFLPLAVSAFRKRHPAIRLRVHSAREDELIALLESGTVGLSLLWDYEWSRIRSDRFALQSLFEDPTMLVVSADHREARRRRVEMVDLSAEDWIIRADHPVEHVLQRSCRAAGFEPRISFHANDYQEAQAMVSVGLGVALAPRSALVNKHPGVRVLSLGSTAPSRRILLAHRHDRVRAAAEVAFQTVLTELAAEYQHPA